MITLAFAQLVYYLGLRPRGLWRRRRPQHQPQPLPGLIDLRDKASFYWLCFALLLRHPVVLRPLRQLALRLVLRGAKSNELRMTALGFPVFRYRLVAFTLSGAFGGLAGILLANEGAYVSPAMMSWVKSGDLIVIVVLGGMGALFGPLYGAIAFFVLEELLKPLLDLLHKGWGEYWQIVFGPHAGARSRSTPAAASIRCWGAAMAEPLLVDRPPGQALRRPARHRQRLDRRAAGRDPRPDRPQRRRQDHPGRASSPATCGPTPAPSISPAATSRACRRMPACGWGSARSFQITSVLREFSALDNVALAVQAHAGHSFRFLRRRAPRREPARRRRGAASTRSGLAPAPTRRPPALSHGEQRQLEIAMALAGDPRAAAARRADGRHGRRGIQRMVGFLHGLKGQLRHAADRARHGRRLRAGRPHHRAGLWPRHRLGHAGTRSAPTPRCARPISARRPPDAAGQRASKASTARARRCSAWTLAHRCRRGRDPDGPQRHGQDHDRARHHGPAARAPRHRSSSRASASISLPSFRIARLGLGLVPEGRQIFPNLSVRENLVAAAANRIGRPQPWTSARASNSSRGSPSARATAATSSRAASSRCWRSAAR